MPTLPRNSLPQSTALLLIDVQTGFDDPYWGERNNPEAEQVIHYLIGGWRQTGRPVVHVQHLSADLTSPLHPANPGCRLKRIVEPAAGEPLFRKRVNNAFIGTELETHLRHHGIQTLVAAGLTTDHCVSTSVRMAGNLGFRVLVAADATAAFARVGHDGCRYSAQAIHETALASLHGEFADVLTSEAILSRL
jgi:nicotinamidase-related amidase